MLISDLVFENRKLLFQTMIMRYKVNTNCFINCIFVLTWIGRYEESRYSKANKLGICDTVLTLIWVGGILPLPPVSFPLITQKR